MDSASAVFDSGLNLKATELRLGLPGSDECGKGSQTKNNKRSASESDGSVGNRDCDSSSAKLQVVGWPPVRSHRKTGADKLVKVSMDGAPYLRKIDLKLYTSYLDLVKALEEMFKCSIGLWSERSEYVPTYEDKDGDWMLAGDVPWDMFAVSCRRLRIMKGSESCGL